MKERLFLIGCVCVYTVITSTIYGYDQLCPHPSQRKFRVQGECNGNINSYNCLYNTGRKSYIEFCANNTDKYLRAGLRYVITGVFRNVICSNGSYQPFRFRPNQNTDCVFFKSLCSNIGQIIYQNRSTIHDGTCKCDNTKGYAFVSVPKNNNFCIPSEEDCSCYVKQCPANTTLSSKYECIFGSEHFHCQQNSDRQTNGSHGDIETAFEYHENHKLDMRSDQILVTMALSAAAGVLISFVIKSGYAYMMDADKHTLNRVGNSNNDLIDPFKKEIQPNMLSFNVDEKDERGQTLLMNECQRGNIENVQKLKAKGAFINLKDNEGNSPLHLASEEGHLLVVILLLKSGMEINSSNTKGRTPIYLACNGGHASVVKYLVGQKCDIHKADIYGQLPVMVACVRGNLSIVKTLIKNLQDIGRTDNIGQTLLHYSCFNDFNDCKDIANLLVNKGCDINKADDKGNTPLVVACTKRKMPLVGLLIEKGADVNMTNNDGRAPIYISCVFGDTRILNLLLKNNCHVNKPDNNGISPLMAACFERKVKIVSLLIDNGANINFINTEHETPFYLACLGGSCYIVNLLINKGCKIDQANIKGNTPFMAACGGKNIKIVKRLIMEGVDINSTNNQGQTAFYWSCLFCAVDIATLLIEKGCDINKTDNEGFTPYCVASIKKNQAIVKFLEKKGADTN